MKLLKFFKSILGMKPEDAEEYMDLPAVIEEVTEVAPEPDNFHEPEPVISPIKAFVKNNDNLSMFFQDGDHRSSVVTEEQFAQIMSSKTKEEILDIITPPLTVEEERKNPIEAKKIKEKKEIKEMQGKFEALKDHPDFEVKEDEVHLKGINRSMPDLLIKKFGTVANDPKKADEFLALKRFWMWTCLNPMAQVADKLFDFLVNNCLKLNKEGFFYALRNVVTVGDFKQSKVDNTLTEFVANTYTKVKAVLKQNTTKYSIYRDEEGELAFTKTETTLKDKFKARSVEILGNLKEMYDGLATQEESSENRYTDAHTRTFDIRIGKVVNMNPKDCSWSGKDCAEAGLHFTMDQINHVGCGDTSVLILINPMKVVGIGSQKGRCYEYFPVMAVPKDEVTELLHSEDFDTLQLDSVYAAQELENLEENVKNNFTPEGRKYKINLTPIQEEEVKFITETLSSMKDKIKDRVKIHV